MPAAGGVCGTSGGGGERGSWGPGGAVLWLALPQALRDVGRGGRPHPLESKGCIQGRRWEGVGRKALAGGPCGAIGPHVRSLRVREAREASHAALGPHGRGLGGPVRALSEAEPVRVYIKRLIVRSWLQRLGAGKSEIRRAGQQGSGRRAGGGWGAGACRLWRPRPPFPGNLSSGSPDLSLPWRGPSGEGAACLAVLRRP